MSAEPVDIADSIDASMDHIARVSSRRRSLEAAQLEAEEQVCHRIGQAYRAGLLTLEELATIYGEFRLVAMPFFTHRWNASVPFRAQKLLRHIPVAPHERPLLRERPNGPNGTYCGSGRPDPDEPAPPAGMSVVYVLYDANNCPAYVGSTKEFRTRIKRHQMDGKPVDYWTAVPCANRRAAFELENRLLKDCKPYLNKRDHA